MLSHAYATGGCILGAIFGTGTNGAFPLPVSEITKLGNNAAVLKGGDMILNTEWGGFDNTRTVLPSTPFDQKLDRESINPTYQAFEKFISGMYLGEIVRNILLSFVDAVPPLLYRGRSTPVLNKHYGFESAYMSLIETATTVQDIRAVLVEKVGFHPDMVGDEDAEMTRHICEMVATRAAALSGCALAAVLVQTGRARLGGGLAEGNKPYRVGLDGSLAEHYPNFETRMRKALRVIVGEAEKYIEVGMAKDGSGVGAALGALQALKQMQSGTHPTVVEE